MEFPSLGDSGIKEIPPRGIRGIPAALLRLSELPGVPQEQQHPPASTGTAAGREGHGALPRLLSKPRAANGKSGDNLWAETPRSKSTE